MMMMMMMSRPLEIPPQRTPHSPLPSPLLILIHILMHTYLADIADTSHGKVHAVATTHSNNAQHSADRTANQGSDDDDDDDKDGLVVVAAAVLTCARRMANDHTMATAGNVQIT